MRNGYDRNANPGGVAELGDHLDRQLTMPISSKEHDGTGRQVARQSMPSQFQAQGIRAHRHAIVQDRPMLTLRDPPRRSLGGFEADLSRP